MIVRVFVYSRMWVPYAVSVGIVLQKNRTEPSTEIWGQKPIETDRKRKIPHRNNTRSYVILIVAVRFFETQCTTM